MLRLLAVVVALPATLGNSVKYDLPSLVDATFRSFNYVANYTLRESMECSQHLRPQSFDAESVRGARCELCPSCPGYISTQDDSDSRALCLSKKELLNLCSSLATCHSVSWLGFSDGAGNGGRGYINGYECGAEGALYNEPAVNLIVKGSLDVPDCPLGVGAELKRSSAVVAGSKYAKVLGFYEKVGGDAAEPINLVFASLDHRSRIVWHATDCGWVVEVAQFEDPAPTTPGAVCEDDDAAANQAFGFGDSDVANICATAATWGSSYCQHATFAALCPSSCNTCPTRRLDQTAAVQEYANAQCAEVDCCDVVLSSLCAETCAAATCLKRRLSTPPAHVRQALRSTTLRGEMGRRLEQQRKLGFTADQRYEEVYRTFDNNLRTTRCDRAKNDVAALNQAGLYDVAAFHDAIATNAVAHTCPGGDRTWVTTSDTYCQRTNHPALYNGDKKIGKHACVDKCVTTDRVTGVVTTETSDTITDGVNNWCSGNEAGFVNDGEESTNALCLPREECEALCEYLGDACLSFDMHRWRPQCYLNTADCSDNTKYESDGGWDMITKDRTPGCEDDEGYHTAHGNCIDWSGDCDAANEITDCAGHIGATGPDGSTCEVGGYFDSTTGIFFGKAFMDEVQLNCPVSCHTCQDDEGAEDPLERDTWTTRTGFNCSAAAAQPYQTSALDRSGCELECLNDVNCAGFIHTTARADTTASTAECKLVAADCFQGDLTFSAGDWGDAKRSGAELVMRNPHAKCIAVVREVTVDGVDFNGRYVQDENGLWPHEYVARPHEGPAAVYVRDDNRTRLHYVHGDADIMRCDDWVLEFNEADAEEVELLNCTDAPAGLGAKYLGSGFLGLGDGFGDFPCQTGSESTFGRDYSTVPKWAGAWTAPGTESLCEDAVFRGLCPHTCAPLIPVEIANNHYTYQNFDIYPNQPVGEFSQCVGDNDVAAMHLIFVHVIGGQNAPYLGNETHYGSTGHVGFCMSAANGDLTGGHADLVGHQLASADWYNATHSPCHAFEWSEIFAFLCADACDGHPRPEQTIVGTDYDETSAEGALYSQNRRLYTTSSAGPRPSKLVVRYYPTNHTSWSRPYAQTHVNGSADANSSYFDNCAITDKDDPDTADFVRLGTAGTKWYRSTVAVDNSAMLAYVCHDPETCPELTTCVLPAQRMDVELGLLYDGGSRSATHDAGFQALDLAHYAPKTLVAEHRATALLSTQTWAVHPTVFRNVPGSTYVEVTMAQKAVYNSFAADASADCAGFAHCCPNAPSSLVHDVCTDAAGSGDLPDPTAMKLSCQTTCYGAGGADQDAALLVSLVDPAAAGGYYAETELGRTFPEVDGYGAWITDAIRIERFNGATKEAEAGEVGLRIFVGDLDHPELFQLIQFEAGGEPTALPAVPERDSANQFTGYFTATVLARVTDLVGTLDVNECAQSPCHRLATCENTWMSAHAPLGYACTCADGYVGDGITECALKAESYPTDAALDDAMAFYVRISHEDVLDFGWHVRELLFYSDAACTDQIDVAANQVALPAPAVSDTLYEVITSVTNVYTGPKDKPDMGYSHYPHPLDGASTGKNAKNTEPFQYWNQNLLDEQDLRDGLDYSTEWQSECRTCEPGASGTVIEVALKGSVKLGCVKIVQDATSQAGMTFYSKKLKVERGPFARRDCGMRPGQERCAPTMTWVQSPLNRMEATAGAATTMIATQCGKDDTQIFGDILQLDYTELDRAGEAVPGQWSGSYANDFPVLSACACQQLCANHLDAGCRSYKFYETPVTGEVKHCYLQTAPFGDGAGHYGTDEAGGWSGWTSGKPERRYVLDSKTSVRPWLSSFEVDAAALAAGDAATVKIHGAGMPFHAKRQKDTSMLQRMKVVAAGDDCSSAVPPQVTGVYCLESDLTVTKVAGSTTQKVHTLCGPRPSAADSGSVSFEGLAIARTDMDQSYEVCYCAVDCFEAFRWQKAPGTIAVPGSLFTWTVTPDTVLRRNLDLSDEFTLTVTAPDDMGFNDAWELKVVRAWFGCGLEEDSAAFTGPTRRLRRLRTRRLHVDRSNVTHNESLKAFPQQYYYTAPTPDAYYAAIPDDMATRNPTPTTHGSNVCTGPDVCSWTYTSHVKAADVGEYLVCFRATAADEWTAIPSKTGNNLQIEALAADATHPRGIFHNQYFSTLAGASTVTSLELAGSRLAIPSSGRLAFTSGACGELGAYNFAGALVKDVTDTTPPMFERDLSFPLNGEKTPLGVRLTFSERITTTELDEFGQANTSGVSTCVGKAHFVDGAGAVAESIACADFVVLGNSVIVYPTTLAAATYSLILETGAVSDLAGNALTLVLTDSTAPDDAQYSIEIDATEAPSVLATNPSHEAAALVDKELRVFFSAAVNVHGTGTGSVVVRDCGADHVCTDDDGVVESYTTSPSVKTIDAAGDDNDGSTMVITLGSAVADAKKYKVSIPADFVRDTTNSNANTEHAFDLTFDASGFHSLRHTLSLSASSRSTADALYFDLQLAAGSEPGMYSVCYCSGQGDESLSSAERHGDTTYALEEDSKCGTGGAADVQGVNSTAASALLLGFSVSDHACETKCAAGCLGSHCYCDGYTAEANSYTLCLPKAECAQACDLLGDECTGINVHDDVPQCMLLTTCNSPDTDHSQAWQYFAQKDGAACTHFSDFTETAGTLAVTARVNVGVDYIVTPNSESSIELTGGAEFMGFGGGLLSADRITIVDFGGTCGVSSPTASLSKPANADKIGTWSLFWPKTYFYDEPSVDAENTQRCVDTDAGALDSHPSSGGQRGPGGCGVYTGSECGLYDDIDFSARVHCCVCGGGKNAAVTLHASEKPQDYYGSDDDQSLYHGFYCPGNNFDLSDRGSIVAVDGAERSLEDFSCHSKCSVPCSGDHCYCDGYMSGYDTEESNAICASENVCKFLCDQLDDCASVDMHMTLNRCYLNTKNPPAPATACAYSVHDLARDAAYKVIVKQKDLNDYPAQRRLDAKSLLPVQDTGFSWSKMLRFQPIEFKSGGTFKLCFCDSALLGGGQCSSIADYAVEVGKIHSSGVSCLLGKAELQRVACTEQYWGGLRCYAHMDAPMPEVPALGAISREWYEREQDVQDGGSTLCMFEGEEVDCQTVSGYQSAA